MKNNIQWFIVVILSISLILSIYYITSRTRDELNSYTIEITPPEYMILSEACNITASITGAKTELVYLNYTDIYNDSYSKMMNFTNESYYCNIPPQQNLGTIRYNVWAQSQTNIIATTDVFTLKVILNPFSASNLVIAHIKSNITNRNEVALLQYSPLPDFIHIRPLFRNTTISNQSGFNHIVSNFESMFYTPVLFSNDTSIQTCIFVNLENLNIEIQYFKGSLYLNNTQILNSMLNENITITSFNIPLNNEYYPSIQMENATNQIISMVQLIRGDDSQTIVLQCSEPVKWDVYNKTEYYWTYQIPNLWPGTFQQSELWLISSENKSSNYNEGSQPYLSVTIDNEIFIISRSFIGTEDSVFVVFTIPNL